MTLWIRWKGREDGCSCKNFIYVKFMQVPIKFIGYAMWEET